MRSLEVFREGGSPTLPSCSPQPGLELEPSMRQSGRVGVGVGGKEGRGLGDLVFQLFPEQAATVSQLSPL